LFLNSISYYYYYYRSIQKWLQYTECPSFDQRFAEPQGLEGDTIKNTSLQNHGPTKLLFQI
jgi:hypothetical protein